jgi:hypothetical protein
MSTVEVVGLVTALASAPILNGASSTIATNGADSAKNSHNEVSDTTFTPAKFVRRYGDAGALITNAVRGFRADVKALQYPLDEESYHLPKETKAGLETVLERKRGMRR